MARGPRSQLYREDFCSLANPDAELIQHAPTDIPALLAEVDRLREALHATASAGVDEVTS
jgi:hypothetical protein